MERMRDKSKEVKQKIGKEIMLRGKADECGMNETKEASEGKRERGR